MLLTFDTFKIKRASWRNTREREFKTKNTKGCAFKERLQNMKEKNETLVQFLMSKEVKANLLIICKANRQAIFTLSSLGCHREPREPYNIVDLVLLMMMNRCEVH
ncbi:uncharacterized protein LOC128214862 [Mya arenaria]|uniref:uncharacterized protein LOC128214862 n=1 Tax=Mya arenaria TaxID=6604 RepID=UPI0022E64441|nr:uncharacterized protein LOC128214862 [Mya arenaria]